MAQKLVPCPGCFRHVMLGEPRCPFCAAALPDSLATALVPPARMRMSRAAAFVFSTTLGAAGCSSTTTGSDAAPADTASPTDTPSPTDTQTPTDTPRDTGSPADTGTDVPTDYGTVAPPYGIPAEDAGRADASPPDDAGGAMADYGAPPPPMDAGR